MGTVGAVLQLSESDCRRGRSLRKRRTEKLALGVACLVNRASDLTTDAICGAFGRQQLTGIVRHFSWISSPVSPLPVVSLLAMFARGFGLRESSAHRHLACAERAMLNFFEICGNLPHQPIHNKCFRFAIFVYWTPINVLGSVRPTNSKMMRRIYLRWRFGARGLLVALVVFSPLENRAELLA